MSTQHGRSTALCTLIVFAILAAGCQPAVTQVSTIAPEVIPGPTRSPMPASTATPTITPSPVFTQTPAATQTDTPVSGPFRKVVFVDEVLPGTVESLVATADGTLWLITDQGVARLVDTTWQVYLASFAGEIAGIDPEGRVWVVNEDASQISAWNGKEWAVYGVEAGWTPLPGDFYRYVRGGRSDLQGEVWFATSQDVRVFQGNQWIVYTPNDMGMGSPVYEDLMAGFEVTVSKSGVVWVAECDWGGPGPFGGRGIRWFEAGAWRGATSPVASGCATVITEDSHGNAWAGADTDLWRYEPASDTWIIFASPESPVAEMRFGFFDSLAVDSDGSMWLELVLCGGASCYGSSVLYHFQDELWTQVGEVGMYDSGFWGPLFDAAGTPWLYREGGIYRVRENTPELVSPLAARFGAVDQSGRVWLVAPYENRQALWVLDEKTGK